MWLHCERKFNYSIYLELRKRWGPCVRTSCAPWAAPLTCRACCRWGSSWGSARPPAPGAATEGEYIEHQSLFVFSSYGRANAHDKERGGKISYLCSQIFRKLLLFRPLNLCKYFKQHTEPPLPKKFCIHKSEIAPPLFIVSYLHLPHHGEKLCTQ